MQLRVLILGSNCRKQEKVWQHIKGLIAKFKKRFVKVRKCPLVHVIFSGKTLGRNHSLIYLAWHALGQTFSKKWNMMPLLHWVPFSSKVDYYNRLKRFTLKAGAGSSNRLSTSRFVRFYFLSGHSKIQNSDWTIWCMEPPTRTRGNFEELALKEQMRYSDQRSILLLELVKRSKNVSTHLMKLFVGCLLENNNNSCIKNNNNMIHSSFMILFDIYETQGLRRRS